MYRPTCQRFRYKCNKSPPLKKYNKALYGIFEILLNGLYHLVCSSLGLGLYLCLCPGDYDKMRVDRGEQKIEVARSISHPFFHEYTFDSDIALLYLAQPVEFGPYATPACLPNPNLALHLQRDGITGITTGWGHTSYLGRSSRFLRKVALPVVDQMKCMASTEQVRFPPSPPVLK